MQDFYVYIHRKATTGEVFYVGKGYGDRSSSRNNRNVHWQRIVAKHGYTIELVTTGIQEWYAFELEKEMILFYGRRADNTGTLVNMTDGGEGISGFSHSDESKKKMADAKKGNTFMCGVRRTTESRKTMSEAKRSKMKNILCSNGITYESTHAASKATGARQGVIVNCLKGRCKTAGGYTWEYA